MVTPEERERTARKLEDPALISDVVSYVSVGNSLIDLCEIWQVTYYVVSNHLYKHHKDEYEAAIITRGEWMDSRILDEIKSIGLADIRTAYDDQGKLKDPKDWPAELARVVSAVETMEEYSGKGDGRQLIGYTKRLKLWDKLKALELLGRNRRLFKDDAPRPVLFQIFQNIGQDKTSHLPVEERIALIETALRGQLSQNTT